MKRRGLVAIWGFAVLLLSVAPTAAAAGPPVVSGLAATNIQGVSALLTGEVDPEGLATTYSFEYVDQAGFEASGFAGAVATPVTAAGSTSGLRRAAAALSALAPDTTYRYRLIAHNPAGDAVSAPAEFTTTNGFGLLPGSSGFEAVARADGGAPATLAGSHPYALTVSLGFNLGGESEDQPGVSFPDGDLRDLTIELPPGLTQNPAALPKCTAADFSAPRSSAFEASRSGESCPDATQVGTVEIRTAAEAGTTRSFGVFNLVPPAGVAAQLGFAPFGAPIVLDTVVRTAAAGRYTLSLEAVDFPQRLDVSGLDLSLWGTPWAASHDGERGNCLNEVEPGFPWAKCSVGPPSNNQPLSFLAMPTDCDAPLAFVATATSWQQPTPVSASYASSEGGEPLRPQGCTQLPFESFPAGQLTTAKASSASGFRFQLLNQDDGLVDPERQVASQVRRAVVSLPDGVTINPSVGAGLGVCTPGQYTAETAVSAQGEACPNGSKIGDFTVRTPLFSEALDGAIYLAQPDDPATPAPGAENPFDSLLAVYLVAKSPPRGVLVKVAGKLVPDPATGRLVATFDDLPQLPYAELDVHFRSGQRAPLITPPACGSAITRIQLTPWAEGIPPPQTTTGSPITAGSEGGACPGPGAPPFSPGVRAGGVNSNVGSYTPYFVHLTRRDTEQELTSYSLVLPRGITGRLAGIPFCPDAAIAAARARSGVAETAQPSCPAASRVGRTVSSYGVGSALTTATGRVYLAGPYNGSPLSLVTIDSATVGPFDLGTVVIRSAFDVDPATAQLQIDARASDPIPHILEGIPLHLREVRIFIDRPQFTRNPSSCEPAQLVSTLTGSGARFGDPSDDSTARVAAHFQLLNCRTLGFRPKLGLRLRGGSRRGDHPSLRTTFAARPGDANLDRIAVTMPHSLFLANDHIEEICTRVQFAADACPPGSVYGRAVAYTPLFDEPLRGSVYLRSSNHRLPDLVASLHSGAVHIVLTGRISPAKGGIRTFFGDLPDAPLDRFVLTMFGGSRGLLVNSADICTEPPSATVKALGQNNLGAVFKTELRGQCKRGRHSSRKESYR